MTSFHLIGTCTKRLIKYYLLMNHFAKLKYFRDFLDLKETTSDVSMCINKRTLFVNFTDWYFLQLKILRVKFTNTFHVQKMQIHSIKKYRQNTMKIGLIKLLQIKSTSVNLTSKDPGQIYGWTFSPSSISYLSN